MDSSSLDSDSGDSGSNLGSSDSSDLSDSDDSDDLENWMILGRGNQDGDQSISLNLEGKLNSNAGEFFPFPFFVCACTMSRIKTMTIFYSPSHLLHLSHLQFLDNQSAQQGDCMSNCQCGLFYTCITSLPSITVCTVSLLVLRKE